MKILRPALAVILLLSICIGTMGCGGTPALITDDLTARLLREPVASKSPDEAFIADSAEISFRLFGELLNSGDENVLISPTSILYALTMVGAGADRNTLKEFETLLGCDAETMSRYLCGFTDHLGRGGVFHVANSVWIRDTLEPYIKEEFLQRTKNYFDASVFVAPFDNRTVKDMNAWISKNTDGMIKKLLDKLNPATVMALINTVLLDLKWTEPYEEYQVKKGTFTQSNGTETEVDFLCSSESYYLEGYGLYGVRKTYENGYSLAAFLPENGKNIRELAASLTGEQFLALLKSETIADVTTKIPKFEAEYKTSLVDTLKVLGLTEAFDPWSADFTNIADFENETKLYISNVLHKTKIELTEAGTKAAAVTAVIMDCNSSDALMPRPQKVVILDEPFLYAIIDNQTGLPIFIGLLTQIDS